MKKKDNMIKRLTEEIRRTRLNGNGSEFMSLQFYPATQSAVNSFMDQQ